MLCTTVHHSSGMIQNKHFGILFNVLRWGKEKEFCNVQTPNGVIKHESVMYWLDVIPMIKNATNQPDCDQMYHLIMFRTGNTIKWSSCSINEFRSLCELAMQSFTKQIVGFEMTIYKRTGHIYQF